MKKRILVFTALTLSLFAALCACGEKDDENDDKEQNEGTASSITLSAESAEIQVGSEYTLTAELTEVESVVWEIGDETVAVIAADGTSAVVTAVAEGTTVVYARSAADESIYAQCEITVIASKLSVFLPTGSLVLRSKRQATVKAVAEDGLTGEAVWTSSDTEIATVEYQGLIAVVTSVAKGECTITVTYGGAKASFTVIVGV